MPEPGGFWVPEAQDTKGARCRRFIKAVAEWCRRHRNWDVEEQHAALTRRIAGHFNYFGVNGILPGCESAGAPMRRLACRILRRPRCSRHFTF